jgi:hypothetical protein
MANKRMFSKMITASDAFVDMPATSQLLYFHLNMEADDDGFVSNPKRIIRMINVGDDDLKILLAKRFLLPFESGVVVIKHWLLHNAVRKDMYKETQYLDEKKLLQIKENGAYTELRDETVTKPLHRLGQDRLDKDRIERTPAQEAKDFFEGNTEEIFNELKNKLSLNSDLLKIEFQKFILYWTEKNKSGTKQRWEQQSTFEVKRRLATWLGKMKDFTSKNNKPNYVL